MIFFRPFNVSLISSFCHWEITAVPIDCRDGGLVDTRAQSFSAVVFKEAQKYHSPPSCQRSLSECPCSGQSAASPCLPVQTMTGAGNRLSSGPGGCQTQRYGEAVSEKVHGREKEAEREEKGTKSKRYREGSNCTYCLKIAQINLSSGLVRGGKCKMILSIAMFTTSPKQPSLKFHCQRTKKATVPKTETKSGLITSFFHHRWREK